MRIVRGFAFGLLLDGRTFMFGKNVNLGSGRSYEALATNNLTLFDNKTNARQASAQCPKKTRLVELALEIAETEAEIESLKTSGRVSFIVIMKNVGPCDKDLEFLGRQTNVARAYPLPGAYLSLNGWKPFTSFSAAEWTAREAARQGRCYTTIATFKIKRL